jgi:alanyl-tRNA synthetase
MSSSQGLPASQIRSEFLKFFSERGHEVVPSAPLVPQNDPTLMFVNAGMVQFKDVFTGREQRPYKRAASSQKCIRISGKHNDLENVGVTARHHTFFEMLGNFSFGDYFKEDAIAYAWDFLTRVVQVPKERMVVTVFNGEGGLPADDEAAEIWRKVSGFGDDRIIRLGLADNFWSMGDTGPCGPCSEIHFFHGDGEADPSKFGDEPRIDGMGWTEIWNNVFMQYDRAEKGGALTPLPAQSVDTGMGLERISAVVQGVTSNYDTDLLRVLVDETSRISGKPYGGTLDPSDVSMRVVADHARTTAFLIAEGVMPEKQKREYVLRRVMRRAIRHGHRLGIEQPFLHQVASVVIDHMGDAYPELRARRDLVLRVTEDEEVRFRQTLKRGVKILDERFEEMRQRSETTLAAAPAADLYTTYGFPLDLTEVIAREAGFGVDLEGAEKIVKGADEVDGPIDPNAALDTAYHELSGKLAATTFSGYEREDGESPITALVRVKREGEPGKEKVTRAIVERVEAGTEIEVAVETTPFYAESGGQVGDSGTITTSTGARVVVTDTVRPKPGLTIHRGRLEEGSLLVGDVAKLEVDHTAREATRRNHSATHLLHWALRVVLGEHAQQKGSRVAPDMLRFDFAHGKSLTREEIAKIEDLVNAKVLENAPITTEVLPIAEARKKGAVAIFEEKYGDVVRVLTMTQDSVELCGGTHARALGDIGLFKIESEGGVAAGVRRILASTGLNTLRRVREVDAEVDRARTLVKAQGGDLVDKIGKLVAHEKELEKKIAELERKLLEGGGGGMDAMLGAAKDIGGLKVLAHRVADGTPVPALRELGEKLRDKLGESGVVLVAAGGEKVALCIMVAKAATARVKAGDLVKTMAAKVGGSGGGRPDMAQAGGPDVAKIDETVASFADEVARAVAS